MSCYNNQEFDFITRTLKIIDQYEEFKIKDGEKFEVTLLLNCLIGLLILPQQIWYERMPLNLISESEWGIIDSHILFMQENEIRSIKNITRHFRNSISHYKFKVFSNSSNEINDIKFQDFNPNGIKTFDAIIPIENFKVFVLKFSENCLKEMLNYK